MGSIPAKIGLSQKINSKQGSSYELKKKTCCSYLKIIETEKFRVTSSKCKKLQHMNKVTGTAELQFDKTEV